MPYKTDSKKLDSHFIDRRSKLLPCQKERMIAMRAEGLSQRALARIFKVSRRTVQFIIDPDKLKANLIAREKRGGSKQYYDKEKHREYIKDHRRYKHNTLNKLNKDI